MSLHVRDYDYHLPKELIASHPLENRSSSRMLVVHRDSGKIEDRKFADFSKFINPGDCVVLNDTKVIPARLWSDDGRKELLVLDRPSECVWRCLVKPGKSLRLGHHLTVGGCRGTVTHLDENGDRLITWERPLDLNEHGHLALPHYMGRDDELADRERYQTIYARNEGAIAAPTAGLHFSPEILASVPHTFLTLHVGVGTFRPVSAEVVTDHVMHSEKYLVSAETAAAVNRAERVIAIGTTVTRVLESLALPSGQQRIAGDAQAGETAIFLHPPYQFRAVDGLLTNFHLPKSTLIMLVCAFAGKSLAMAAYEHAVKERYRFYSYGDCMLIL